MSCSVFEEAAAPIKPVSTNPRASNVRREGDFLAVGRAQQIIGINAKRETAGDPQEIFSAGQRADMIRNHAQRLGREMPMILGKRVAVVNALSLGQRLQILVQYPN
jgi:hypothetical protein